MILALQEAAEELKTKERSKLQHPALNFKYPEV